MDAYTKGVLTVIALLLVVIAAGVWYPHLEPKPMPPTWGDMLKLKEEENSTIRTQKHKDLIGRMPFVKVYGSVDVNGY